MTRKPLVVGRNQILSFRLSANGLDERRARTETSLRCAAWAGLQDSMPRAATLSMHARLHDIDPFAWSDPALVQVWGPRYSAYTIAAEDVAIFTLGRLPDGKAGRDRAFATASEVGKVLGSDEMAMRDVSRAIGGHVNRIRYAATTGTVAIRWDGARQPTIRMLDPPDVEPWTARKALVARFLRVFGPSTASAFSAWAGLTGRSSTEAFARLQESLTPVSTPIGDAWILDADVDHLSRVPGSDTQVRLLPSGDAYYLLQGEERDLLVPSPTHRDLLWTPRVWPGGILVDGEVVGTWRRSTNTVTVSLWKKVPRRVIDAIGTEAEGLPIPGAEGTMRLEIER